jgi:hypothetical protein
MPCDAVYFGILPPTSYLPSSHMQTRTSPLSLSAHTPLHNDNIPRMFEYSTTLMRSHRCAFHLSTVLPPVRLQASLLIASAVTVSVIVSRTRLLAAERTTWRLHSYRPCRPLFSADFCSVPLFKDKLLVVAISGHTNITIAPSTLQFSQRTARQYTRVLPTDCTCRHVSTEPYLSLSSVPEVLQRYS